jgi:hypothetical protein
MIVNYPEFCWLAGHNNAIEPAVLNGRTDLASAIIRIRFALCGTNLTSNLCP